MRDDDDEDDDDHGGDDDGDEIDGDDIDIAADNIANDVDAEATSSLAGVGVIDAASPPNRVRLDDGDAAGGDDAAAERVVTSKPILHSSVNNLTSAPISTSSSSARSWCTSPLVARGT